MKLITGLVAAALLAGCGEAAGPSGREAEPDDAIARDLTKLGDLSSGKLDCRITRKHVCDDDGCRPVEAKVWNVIDLDAPSYARCDSMGCDTYPAAMTMSGIYKSVALPQHGAMAKVGTDGTFVETVTLGTVAYVSHGRCAYPQAESTDVAE